MERWKNNEDAGDLTATHDADASAEGMKRMSEEDIVREHLEWTKANERANQTEHGKTLAALQEAVRDLETLKAERDEWCERWMRETWQVRKLRTMIARRDAKLEDAKLRLEEAEEVLARIYATIGARCGWNTGIEFHDMEPAENLYHAVMSYSEHYGITWEDLYNRTDKEGSV
jgi:hypothetical protein